MSIDADYPIRIFIFFRTTFSVWLLAGKKNARSVEEELEPVVRSGSVVVPPADPLQHAREWVGRLDAAV